MGDMQDMMMADTAEDACGQGLQMDRGEEFDRCVGDVNKAYADLKRDLASGARKPKNCHEWSVSAGTTWEAARPDMRVNPLASKKNPVIFGGIIDDGDEGVLMVRSNRTNAIAKVTVTASTVVLSDLNVGGGARGYGIQVGKQSVTLTDGSATTIPVIQAACIQ